MPSSISVQRREQQRLQMQERILQAATDMLVQDGVEGFSMRRLAKKIGYTATAIYFHFQDRESLLGAVLDCRFREFRQSFDRLARFRDPMQRLSEMGRAFVEFGLRQPAHYRLMFLTSWSQIPKERFLEKGNPSQDCYAYLLATVREALAMKRFRPEFSDAEQLAQIFFAGVHGIVSLHLVKGDDDWVTWRPVRPKARRMIEALLRGLSVSIDPPPAATQSTRPTAQKNGHTPPKNRRPVARKKRGAS